jgi:hypothetical protein
MTMAPERPPHESSPSPEDLRQDTKLEVFLDEMVSSAPALEDEFTRRVLEGRPFAPWEVRRPSAWKFPAVAMGGLLAASLVIFLAPLWSLGPGTALAVWGRVLTATLSGTVSTALSSAPAVAEALAGVLAQSPDVRNVALFGLAVTGTLGVFLLRVRRRRENLS